MQADSGAVTTPTALPIEAPVAQFSLLGEPCLVLAKDGAHDGGVIGELRLFGRSFVVALDPGGPAAAAPEGPARSGLHRLTRREREIALLIAQGSLTKQIARELGLSPHTVGAYVNRIFAKLCVHNRAEMVAALISRLS
jgi:DNA-binding CsgD family transcriptional regulator